MNIYLCNKCNLWHVHSYPYKVCTHRRFPSLSFSSEAEAEAWEKARAAALVAQIEEEHRRKALRDNRHKRPATDSGAEKRRRTGGHGYSGGDGFTRIE